MIYYTGDIHGNASKIVDFTQKMKLTTADTIVILGDVGANYCGDERDSYLKHTLSHLNPTIFCIHGNHEMRPSTIKSYKLKVWNDGSAWYEDEYPNILFAKDGDIYTIEGVRHLVIGGAYSVDKFYRLSHGYGWWDDEQPSDKVKGYVEKQISEKKFDVILSHTCPMRYEPIEMFLSQIDQSTVDSSTEEWLDIIENKVEYLAWYCGHWHTDKRIDKMHFLFNGFESSDMMAKDK